MSKDRTNRTHRRTHRRTPRAGARMSGTQPTRRSTRLAAKKKTAKSKAAFTMTGMFDALGDMDENTVSRTARKVKGKTATKRSKKPTAKAKKIAKQLKTMNVNELTDLFSGFKM